MNYVLLRCFLMTTFQSGRRPAWNRCVMTGWRPWTLTHLLDGALCHFITPDKITTSAILKPSTAISNSLQQRITMDMHEVLRSYSFVCQICLTRGEEKRQSHMATCAVWEITDQHFTVWSDSLSPFVPVWSEGTRQITSSWSDHRLRSVTAAMRARFPGFTEPHYRMITR